MDIALGWSKTDGRERIAPRQDVFLKRPPKTALVWVTWLDACGDSCRAYPEDLKSVALARNANLGWIVDRDDTRIVLAHGYSSSDEIDHIAIPTGNVISIEPAAVAPRKPSKDLRVKEGGSGEAKE